MLQLATAHINDNQMDAVLRAAHSIKGGAAMMGFQTLSIWLTVLKIFSKY